jgi:signal transduction histidine kinase/DNA-binding response OmpR family regulator
MKVLIVDPEPNRLLDTGRVLQGAGHQVLGAGTGEECVRTAKEKRPDLILLDPALPDVSGIDLAKEIKRDPELANAYVVLLFVEESPSTIRARALESGADGHMLRTLPKREFLARVEAMLRRKRREEALRASVREWKDTLDAISDPVYLVDLEHGIRACNLAMAKFLRKPPSEIVGRNCYELVHGTSRPIPACLNQRVQETRRRETLDVPMGDGWLHVAVDPLLDEKDNLIGTVHILSDASESRQTQEALAEAEAALQTEADGRQQAEQALSQARAKMEKQAADHLAVLARADDALQSEVAEYRAALAQSEEARQSEAAARQQVEQALSQERAEWARQADTYHGALAKASEALQAEAAARKQAEPVQRMEAVAQLAGGVAQRLNELLSVLLGSAEVALAQVDPSYAVHNELTAIQRTGRQVVALAGQLLAISRQRLVQMQALDLNGLITGLSKVLPRLVGEQVNLDVQLAPELRPVFADADAMEQALMNLTENARASMPEGGTLRIHTEEATLDDAYCQSHPGARPGAYVRLTVADTGTAVGEAMEAHLFEPFSAAGESATRSELGLAVVYGTVKQHGGLIEARAQPDGGTLFEILLPVHEGE